MKKIVILWSLSLISGFLSAQTRPIDPKMDPRNFSEIMGVSDFELLHRAYDLSKYEVLDTSRIIVFYKKEFLQDKEKKAANIDTMRLSVGTRYSVFFSNCLFHMDSVFTAYGCAKEYGGVGRYEGSTYYRDLTNGNIRVINRIPYMKNSVVEYTQSSPDYNWEMISDSVKSILGYRCLLAKAKYGGREWFAWFSPELPLDSGPWKLCGLPGLILKAEDTDHEYVFNAIALSPCKTEIKRYIWNSRTMTLSKWLDFARKMHAHPYDYVSNGGKTLFLHLSDDATKPYLERETWVAPYNPIERE